MDWRNVLIAAAALLLAACSRDAWSPAGKLDHRPGGPNATGEQGAGVAGLPALGKLPSPPRASSLSGPGFFPLDPLAPLSSAGTSVDGSVLVVDGDATGSGTPAFAVYGLSGFGPGVGMTSARLTMDGVVGEYYVAFADYVLGHWQLSGPYTDSVTAEIFGGGTPNPADYLSPGGFAYFAVICGSGNRARLKGAELGLQGDSNGPAPVTFARYTGMASPYAFIWTRSASYADPDFAGYMVERAPLLTGDFTSLTPTPTKDHYFLDDTITPGSKYRIRVAAVDLSGNKSAWYEVSGPNDEPADPVCILKAPAGPIDAPQLVTFDLSDSFDPLGQAIIEYHVGLGSGVGEIISPDPLITVNIQPGCYIAGASILTADTRYGDDSQPLKAYPTWQSDPVVVRDTATGDGPAWSQMRMYRDPASGRLSLCALDNRYPGVSLWRENGSGGFDWAVLPDIGGLYGWQDQLEPVVLDSLPQFLLTASSYRGDLLGAAELTGPDSAHYAYLSAPQSREAMFGVFTGGDGQPWAVKRGRSGGDYYNDFVAAPLSDLASETLICDGWQLDHYAHITQDPQTGIVHILGGSTDMTPDPHPFYAQFDPALNQTPVLEDMQGSTYLNDADIEVVPATGDVWSAWYDGTYVKTRTRTGGIWQAPVYVDNADANQSCFDLEIGASAPCILISVGRPRLYSWSGAAWVQRNQASYTADVAREASLAVVPDTDEFIGATIASTGELFIGALHPDGTDEQLHKLVPTSGAGPHLSAAADDAGVHVIARSNPNSTTYHYYSDDGCTSFTKLGDLTACNWLDLTATTAGQVHLSASDFSDCSLRRWNGSSFVSVANKPLNVFPAYPMLSQAPEDKVRWAMVSGTPTLHFEITYGNPVDGYSQTSMGAMSTFPLAGVLSPQVLFPRIFCIDNYDDAAGQYNFADLITIPGGAETDMFTPLQTPFVGLPENNARCCSFMAASYCLNGPGYQTGQIYWSAFGEDGRPVRASVQADGSYTLAPLPGVWDSDPLGGMPLRSMQAAQANGTTAVCVAAGLFGDPLVMEWSDYGDWEELPVPASMAGMSKYELCVDRSGNWHLFAHDWKNDRVVCLNTVSPPPD